jgi:hypothetical protein
MLDLIFSAITLGLVFTCFEISKQIDEAKSPRFNEGGGLKGKVAS